MKAQAKFYLLSEQQKMIESVVDAAIEADESGKPGMIIAQIYQGTAYVGFVENEKAIEVIKLLDPRGYETKLYLVDVENTNKQ